MKGKLAESWTREDDGSYTFTLRSATSSFGNELTAEDVKWSYERMIELDPVANFFFNVANIDVDEPITIVDNKTVTLNLTKPNVIALRTTVMYHAPILDSTEALLHATAEDPWAAEWLDSNIAGFGPYQLGSFSPGEELRLEVNENYWDGIPYFEQVVVRSVPDSSTRLTLLATGEIDFASRLSAQDFGSVLENEDILAIQAPIPNIDYIYLNYAFEPFSDPRVRQAMAIAIDREPILEAAYDGLGRPALFHFNSLLQFPAAPPPEPYAYDPDLARELLAEAGYEDGFEFTMIAHPGRPGPQAESVAVLVKSQLEQIGIQVNIEVLASSSEFGEGKGGSLPGREGRFEAWLDQGQPLIVDVAYHAELVYGTTGVLNWSFSNARLDELIDLAITLEDGPERDEILRELHQIARDETPIIPVVETVLPIAFLSDIAGFYPVANLRVFPHRLSRG